MSGHAAESAGQNRLLAALPPEEWDRVKLICRPVTLANEQTLLAPRQEVRYA